MIEITFESYWYFSVILLQVRVNNPHLARPIFETMRIGKDNAIARHGIHGLYKLYGIQIPSSQLFPGRNTIYLTQTKTEFLAGIMYDYLRLEGPPIKDGTLN